VTIPIARFPMESVDDLLLVVASWILMAIGKNLVILVLAITSFVNTKILVFILNLHGRQ